MRTSWLCKSITTAALALGASLGMGQADVICGALTGGGFQPGGNGPLLQGRVGDIVAYSVGTTSCNIGTTNLNWFQSGADRHPLIINNIYRVNNGAIEQVGVSWVKHGFCALQQTLCGSCNAVCGGCCSQLGVGCSDPYSASLNGSQTGIGPRFEINPATGTYPWPFTTAGQAGDNIYKRIQVHVDDLNPALNDGALYFVEGQYVAKDDADAGNANNNATYRPIVVGPEDPFSGTWFLNFAGDNVREFPAIFGWQAADPNVELVAVDVPGDGRFWVGANVTENGDGTWHYEYAIFNLNSDRAAASFAVPAGAGTANVGFKDVDYHSGEPWDMTDWTASEGGELTWTNGATFASNPQANAIRWGTLYNFRFDSASAPESGSATIGLFKPDAGQPDAVSFAISVPSAGQTGCNAADIAEPFNVLDLADVQTFVAAFTTQGAAADIAAPFGVWDLSDVQTFVAEFTGGCP
jgi:hypothetical protein